MRVTASKIAAHNLLLGIDGKVLKNEQYIRKFISFPERFKSYKFEPTKFSPKGTHQVDIEETREWNKMILNQIATNEKTLKKIKKQFSYGS